jgi:hypothetical protein
VDGSYSVAFILVVLGSATRVPVTQSVTLLAPMNGV